MGVVVAGFGARQHAVVGRRQLLTAGCRASTIDDWLRAGHLHRLHRGVYSLLPPALLTDEGRWLAAVLACGAGSVLSHRPAGQLAWIVDRGESGLIHVSVADRSAQRVPGVAVHRPRHLSARDVTSRRGIPVTTPTRTIWDLAYADSPTAVRRAFEQAEKRHVLDRRRLAALADGAPCRCGSGTIRELLATGAVPLWRTRSRLEEIVLEVCRDHGIPFPAVNVPLFGYEVDFLWERQRFIVEADGADHLNERQRDRDNERDARLTRAGYLVRRCTWWAVQDERAVAAEIAATLREREPGSST